MLRRKAYERLVAWKNQSKGQTSLLLEGARRVGKTTLVKQFAKEQYRSFIFIDFSLASRELIELFESQRGDVDSFLSYLSVYTGTTLYQRDSVIIFDEVQLYPKARGFLKHLVADGRYDYIATGSLISIKRNVESIVIPSEEESFELNPLDFEEFLEALEEHQLAQFLMESATTLKPIPDLIHRKAMRRFREYLLVGGMPQAVKAYVESQDFQEVDKIKRNILQLYRNDIARYAKGYESKVIAIFEEIPAQLSKGEKKFTLSSLGADARMRRYEDAFFWLDDAKIVNTCFNSTDPNVGLGLHKDRLTLKCYMSDTGLLITHAFSDQRTTEQNIYKRILFDKLSINEGMIAENAVAQALHASGHKLYFYSRSNRASREDSMEIDFLIVRESGQKPKISPLEVKSTKRYATTSLGKFKLKFGSRVGEEVVLHTANLLVEKNRIKLPLYLAAWL